MATAREITGKLEEWAPLHWGEEWDNNGYMTGHPAAEVEKVIIALDVTEGLVEAAEPHALIICHHPPVLPRDLHNLRQDRPAGKLLSSAVKKDLVVYAAHTNLDVALGGTADALAHRLDLEDVAPWPAGKREEYCKLVVFVPRGYEDQVRTALSQAGAGWIGNYSHCTYQSPGEGTFMPREGTDPFMGQPDTLEKVSEYRLETIMPRSITRQVVEALEAAHPYEEVAYDLYPLLNPGRVRAYGRLGRWRPPGTLAEWAEQVAHRLEWDGLRVAGDLCGQVQDVVVVPGAGGGLVATAASTGADVLVTGDIGYHQVQLSLSRGMAVIDAGHQATERPVLDALGDWCDRALPGVAWEIWHQPALLSAGW